MSSSFCFFWRFLSLELELELELLLDSGMAGSEGAAKGFRREGDPNFSTLNSRILVNYKDPTIRYPNFRKVPASFGYPWPETPQRPEVRKS